AAVLPDAPDPIDCIAEAYFRMGRIDEAIEKYEEAMAMDDNWSNPLLWYCYALKEDYAEALRWIDKQIPEAQNVSYAWKYFYHAWLGNLDQSLMSLRRIEESLESRQIAWVQWMKGWMYYDRGEFELSRHYFNAYEIDPERSRNLTPEFHHFQIGLVDIAQDRIDSAKFRLAEMKTLLPSLSGYRKQEVEYRYHFLAAEVLLAEGKAQEAITMCKSGLSHPVTDAEFHRQLRYNTPFLRDVQARAYYQIGELDKAIAEYERLTNFDPNSKNRYLIHPKYYYRLGKLYEETGIKAKAIARYEKFFRLWKDADKDLPQVIDAKNRLLNLKRQ
ncbi:MAG: tetratricopeptide repeat protein, partial [Aliifodinibius sp.]|nr:tetratricopeptide repeat protein [candidate division Zixibacteria bacterium]NIT55427.1 tetratricopeptide repeat protein [Fodinibius sp.]NIU12888.1 tetratricopeptide repeat protein [candidate division Zixibacteria bacterium]NIV04957.1 tetratricopeptide repeat protein [candidate division Zixibacteria bacterium]NIW40184.1 tetratricopeptide repeat protein [candidate division Zixibacteria bacterium]